MSIISLVNEQLANPKTLKAPLVLHALTDPQLAANPPPVVPDPVSSKATDALTALTRYIPIEMVTLYTAAIAISASIKAALNLDVGVIYWISILATPIIFSLVYIDQLIANGRPVPRFSQWRQWPWWKVFAATVAFAVWALAVPNNPYIRPEGQPLIGFLVLLVSTLLSLLGPLFEH